jgi:5-methylcytosine-specific restriction protein A
MCQQGGIIYMSEKQVIRIEPKIRNIINDENILKRIKKRVCAYARVSTDSSDQLNSYNAQIKEYTKRRANGTCELCQKEAPFFTKRGEPYLEVHHVITLAENGPDSVTNTVALCPNCHRKIHLAPEKREKDFLVNTILKDLLKDEVLHNHAMNLFKH